MRTRFAPSPTGYLHLGHVLAASQASDFAARHDGQCYLRMEDTDHTRCKAEYSQAILDDLAWLGFDYAPPMRVQSAHYADYARVAANLISRGLAYPCGLTRAQIKAGAVPSSDNAAKFGKDWRGDSAQIITDAARAPKPSLPFAIRLDLHKSINSVSNISLNFDETAPLHAGTYNAKDSLAGQLDPIIARKDIGCSYMIAGPHDDAADGMTHIVRGADLFAETPLQVLLQSLMGWPRPIYYHHGLIMDKAGKKLSKRNFAASIASMRENGAAPQDVLGLAAI